MLRLIALRGVRAHKNVAHLEHRLNLVYRDRSCVVELLLQLENKQQLKHAKQCGYSTQTHVFFIYWQFVQYSLPYGTLCLHRDFTGICENQNAMNRALSTAFYRSRENIYEKSSALRVTVVNGFEVYCKLTVLSVFIKFKVLAKTVQELLGQCR